MKDKTHDEKLDQILVGAVIVGLLIVLALVGLGYAVGRLLGC